MRTAAEAAAYTSQLCASPAIFMLLGSLAVFVKSPPDVVVFMTQHFGAGIVLSAVAMELLPSITDTPKTAAYSWATVIGFTCGVALMVLVATFCGEEEGEEEAEGGKGEDKTTEHEQQREEEQAEDLGAEAVVITDQHIQMTQGAHHARRASEATAHPAAAPRPLLARRKSLMAGYRRHSQELAETEGAAAAGAGGGGVSRWQQHAAFLPSVARRLLSPSTDQRLPSMEGVSWPLVTAVYVDSFMDGASVSCFLIGISSVAGASAGVVMAVALTIEMAFLGLTFSASMAKVPIRLRAALVTGGPVLILVGGSVGSAAASALLENQVLQTGLVSFGAAALLYLVTEELLLEAHEEGGAGHIWYVDMCFFVGFLGSLIVEKNTGE